MLECFSATLLDPTQESCFVGLRGEVEQALATFYGASDVGDRGRAAEDPQVLAGSVDLSSRESSRSVRRNGTNPLLRLLPLPLLSPSLLFRFFLVGAKNCCQHPTRQDPLLSKAALGVRRRVLPVRQ